MNRNFRLSVALDVDDLLMECTEYAIELANKKYDPEKQGIKLLEKELDGYIEYKKKVKYRLIPFIW